MRAILAGPMAVVAALALASGARANNMHLYSYDPTDDGTRSAAGPLTFQVHKGLLHTTVINLRSTEAQATAELSPADQRALGAGGLSAILPAGETEHDLYEVRNADEGAELISALCPGASKAWMAFGRVRMDQDLKIVVISEAPGKGPSLCRTLAYTFHGEWIAPAVGPVMRESNLLHGRFPGT
jgi:hypothetical protein